MPAVYPFRSWILQVVPEFPEEDLVKIIIEARKSFQ
jgi:hypothetical protein